MKRPLNDYSVVWPMTSFYTKSMLLSPEAFDKIGNFHLSNLRLVGRTD